MCDQIYCITAPNYHIIYEQDRAVSLVVFVSLCKWNLADVPKIKTRDLHFYKEALWHSAPKLNEKKYGGPLVDVHIDGPHLNLQIM